MLACLIGPNRNDNWELVQVLVGRNNKQNDELTNRVAKAGDVWMHARGCPGAHVLLRASTCNRCGDSQAIQSILSPLAATVTPMQLTW